MNQQLQYHLPFDSVSLCKNIISQYNVDVKIVKARRTRHGDYRKKPNGEHVITINATENPYRFLITLIHELAHLKVYASVQKKVAPHGYEWKLAFKTLMLPFLQPSIFPNPLLSILAAHIKNPKASTDSDFKLVMALKEFDQPTNKNLIFELDEGTDFISSKGKIFRKGKLRRKRFLCVEIKTGKQYLFSPHAEVEKYDKK
ncbi:MAG: sprT domain-containing protein [Flavobacteriaceae bacterium]|nr:sprT domain-containing protein [Flavobacteriaceae bacterium]